MWRRASLALCALLIVGLCGCAPLGQMLGFPRRRAFVVTGFGAAPARDLLVKEQDAAGGLPETPGEQSPKEVLVRRPGADFPGWASQILEARAGVPLPEEANSHVEAVMLARRQAQERLLRDLATRVAGLPAPGGKLVGEALQQDEDFRSRMDKAIRSSCQFVYGAETQEGTYSAVARLPLEPIALLGWGEIVEESVESGEKRKKAPKHQGKSLTLERLAYEAAVKDAQEKMLEMVQTVALHARYTVGDLMSEDEEAAKRVRLAVAQARIVDRRFPSPGECEVDLELDLRPLVTDLGRRK